MQRSSLICQLEHESFILPFYTDDFHFVPESKKTFPRLTKDMADLNIYTTLNFTQEDLNELKETFVSNKKISFRIPSWGWEEKSDFFFSQGHFKKVLQNLEKIILLFPEAHLYIDYQVNCLTAESFHDFCQKLIKFQSKHNKKIEVNLVLEEMSPSYLAPNLTAPDNIKWLSEGVALLTQSQNVDLLELFIQELNKKCQLDFQVLATFYYSMIIKRVGFSASKTFPRLIPFLKKSAEAFLTIRPKSLLTTRSIPDSSEWLKNKEKDFLNLELANFSIPEKKRFLERFYSIKDHIKCAHSDLEMLEILITVLSLPDSLDGVILEAGIFKGGSTARLSLACEIRNRELVAYDSFKGLPQHKEASPHMLFPQGSYLGSLAEVIHNLNLYGHPKRVTLVEGWFKDTLAKLNRKVAVAFLDVDLASSTAECLRYIWPMLQKGGVIYSHDAHFLQVSEVLHSLQFWQSEFNERVPQIERIPGSSNLIKIIK